MFCKAMHEVNIRQRSVCFKFHSYSSTKSRMGIVYGRGSCVKSAIMDTNNVIFLQLSLRLSVCNQITRIFIF